MSQRFLGSLSAALVFSTVGLMPSGFANESVLEDEGVEENVSHGSALIGNLPVASATGHAENQQTVGVQALEVQPSGVQANAPTVEFSSEESEGTVKVGEYQSESLLGDSPVAVIHSHAMDGRQAATLYVRGIPVLTFLGDGETASSQPLDDQPVNVESSAQPSPLSEGGNGDEVQAEISQNTVSSDGADTSLSEDVPSSEGKGVKLPSPNEKHPSSPDLPADGESQDFLLRLDEYPTSKSASGSPSDGHSEVAVDVDDPVQQATAIAAQINQLYREGVDADEIVAEWDDELERFVIKVDDAVLVEFDSDVILPDTTERVSDDVLQATNRIRRQLGAEPLSSIEGAPSSTSSGSYVAVGPVQFSFTGRASWYGPGFHGRRSASGEVFNQHALTAAHRTLPFGTLVRVTNTNNGASVVVRITDRGPFGGGRVLDLSAGAARAIGMIQSGVATVRAEVLQ